MPPPTSSAPTAWWHTLDPRRHLPVGAALICGGSALALVFLLAWSAGALLHRQLERQLGPSFENLAHQIGDKLERSLYERTRQLQFASHLTPLQNPAAPAAERQALVESLHDASPDYAWIGFADPGGLIRAASQNLFTQENAAELAWFRGARRQTYLGTPREFSALAAAVPAIGADAPLFLAVAVPVNSATGQFLGVLGAQLRWSSAREIQLSVIPESARRARLGVTLYAPTGEVLLDSGGSGWTAPPDAPPGLSDRPGTRGVLTENTTGGTVYLTGHARTRGFREYRGVGWLVVVRQPAAHVFAPVAELRSGIVRLGLVFAAVFAAAAWIFAARLERRLTAVATAAGRIRGGDILALLPQPHGHTAFARMCAALGAMVETFRTRQEVLENENTRLATRPHE